MAEKEKKTNKKSNGRGWVILIAVIIVLSAIGHIAYQQFMMLYERAKDTKHSAEAAVEYLMNKDFEKSQEKVNEVRESIKYFRGIAENEYVYKFGCWLPKYGEDFESACLLLDIADETLDTWSDRAFDLLKTYPLDAVITEDGANVRTALAYLNFAEEAVPAAEELFKRILPIRLSFYDMRGLTNKIREKADDYLDLYHEVEYYFPLIHAILGDGSDKLFLIAAQNTAEIRPCGGFPGAMGTVSVKDGILSIGEFDSVWTVMPYNTPSYLMPDSSVNNLFGGLMVWPRDAEFNPDFEFLGKFWSDVYEYKYGVPLDGVISVTPAIIQDALEIFGSIEVSNGDVLDGTNAVKVLQYDWYVDYMNTYAISYSTDNQNDIVDALFKDTVEQTVKLATSNLDIEKVPLLINLLEESADERVFMLWLRDEAAEETVRSYGFSGGLGGTEEEPEIGIFYGNDYGCKLGWWIDADVYMSEGRDLSDGSREYDVSVTFTNNFNARDTYYMGYYIVGTRRTAVLSWYIYAFAPKGGDVYDMYIDYWNPMRETTYKGLQVGYVHQHYISPGTSSTLRFKVKTAPGITARPVIKQTPTLTKYR